MVETNTLSSVPPPDITYTLSIPNLTINCGLLSALQLEAIIYACQVTLTSDLTHPVWQEQVQVCFRNCIYSVIFSCAFEISLCKLFNIMRWFYYMPVFYKSVD